MKKVKVQKSMDCPDFTSSNTRSKLRSVWDSEGICVFGKKWSHRGNRKWKIWCNCILRIGPHSSSFLVGLDLEYRSICTKLMIYLQILADFKGKINGLFRLFDLCAM